MALVCTSCHVGHIRRTKSDSKVSDVCSGAPSMCHVIIIRFPNMYSSQAVSGVNLGWRKTTRVWDQSGGVGPWKRNGEGPQRYGQWRVALSNSADIPIGINGERTGNGGIRTVALNRVVNSNWDDDSERKFPAGVAERSDSIKPNDDSTKGPANTVTEEKEFSEAEEEGFVSFIWEAGSNIEKVAPERGSLKDRNDTEDTKLTFPVEEERQRQERLNALQGILANFPDSENELNAREAELLAFSEKLMNQSAMHNDEYRRSQEAVGQLMEDVASRDTLLRLLQKEASVSSESLQTAARSLSEAERRIMTLEKRVQTGEEALMQERDKLAAAIKSAGSLEESARVAENKISELTSEISTLKALVAAGRKTEYHSAQVKAFEQELRSRDSLLLEIKGEIKRRTEALSVAAQIKQDFVAARQREVQLTQALEVANNLVKELQTEIVKNVRSLRAEQALKQTEKMLRDTNLEVQLLRTGVEERDKSIHLMKGEVDLNIGLLNDAARDREELRTIKLQMKDLKAELGSKDTKLNIMREEMASVINLARQKSTSSGTSRDQTSPSAVESNPAVQVSKPKKKLQQKKGTSSLRKSVSSPQCS